MADEIYLGNHNLKKANTIFELTQEKIIELIDEEPSNLSYKNLLAIIYVNQNKIKDSIIVSLFVSCIISLNMETNPAAGYTSPDVPMETKRADSSAILCISSGPSYILAPLSWR